MSDLSKRLANLSPKQREQLFQQLNRAQGETASAIQPAARTGGPLPQSFSQQRLWFLDRLTPGHTAYNFPLALDIQGALALDVLSRSLDEIVRRHEALRTTFGEVDERPVQRIHPPTSLALPLVDLSALPPDKQGEELQRITTEAAYSAFDLEKAPPLRCLLVRLEPDHHLFMLVVHHIVFDGWSANLFLRELVTLYKAFAAGRPSPLAEPTIQYADYAVWQQEWLNSERMKTHARYWQERLADAPALLELPTDRPRPPLQSYRGAAHSFVVPGTLVDAIKTRFVQQEEGTTLFMVLLAAFNVLLHRYSHQNDIVLGSPIAGRNRTELENMVGFFLNNLVLRTDLAGDPTFRELVMRVRDVVLGAFSHQELPFERLVEALQPERNLAYSPIFQVMFATLRNMVETNEFAGLAVRQVQPFQALTARYDLVLYCTEVPSGLTGLFEYNTDLFDEATIARMSDHFLTLLEGIVADPDRHLSALPLLTESERETLLVRWNETQSEYARDRCIHDLFAEQVARTPDATAVVCEGRQLNYRQLDEQANALAKQVQTLGVRPGVLVGICVERSLEMMVGLLAILKAGAAYVPLDPSYPIERLAFMLQDARVSVLLTQKHLLSNLPALDAHTILLDSSAGWATDNGAAKGEVGGVVDGAVNGDGEPPVSSATPADLAYVIYTSGSTGKPKGVQLTHRSVVNFLCSMRDRPGLSAQDTLLAVTTLSFDIAVLELFLPLITGAKLVIASRETTGDGQRLAHTLADVQATVMQATPVTWRLLLESGWAGDKRLKALCGGEALPRELANQLLERCASLWNMYGPTETTIWSTLYQVTPATGRVPIGRPIANTHLYILDTHLRPVPTGVVGDLYIGGAGLAVGYLNRPELTQERFVLNPFSPEGRHLIDQPPGVDQLPQLLRDRPQAFLYKTGDLARYLSDGNVDFLGRSDHQVKLRGFRIELGEIESLLDRHPMVRQSVVVLREDLAGEKRLVGYIAVNGDQPPTVDELRRYLLESLPEYMVPAAFVTLDELPLTANNKVDRRALPDPDSDRPDLETGYVAPRNAVEEQIVQLWQDRLRLERVGVHDNFFSLGGNSLLAIQIVSRLRDAFQVDLPPHTLFNQRTVAELAVAIVQKQAEQVDEATLAELLAELEDF